MNVMAAFDLPTSDSDARKYFERLYNDYHGMMFSCALSILKNEHDAEDALQQVWFKIWRYMDNIKKVSPQKLKSYLYITTKNHCYTLLKRDRSVVLLSIENCFDIQDDGVINPEIIAINNLDKKILSDAFNDISPRYRQIILDKAILNLNDEQAAEHIGIKSTYVRECLLRARASLRQKYLLRLQELEHN